MKKEKAVKPEVVKEELDWVEQALERIKQAVKDEHAPSCQDVLKPPAFRIALKSGHHFDMRKKVCFKAQSTGKQAVQTFLLPPCCLHILAVCTF